MERINKLINHPLYKEYIGKIESYECQREFCRHDRKHFLDVSRIAYLFYLEEEELQESLPYTKEQLRRLEEQLNGTCKFIFQSLQDLCSTQQHGSMTVMAAGMHYAVI